VLGQQPAVQQLLDLQDGPEWAAEADAPRTSLVLVGRGLQREALSRGLAAVIANSGAV
jgi:predicted nucleic acid-binding Zn ribbon protein